MEKIVKYDEYCIICYIDKLATKFAVRERFFVPQDVLSEQDLLAMDAYLSFHAKKLDGLMFKKYKAYNLESGYVLTQCETGLTENNYNYKKNLAYNIHHANKNLESWLNANASQKKDKAFFTKQAKVFHTKQEVFDEIVGLTKLEYEYAGRLASLHKLCKKKTLQKFEYDHSKDNITPATNTPTQEQNV